MVVDTLGPRLSDCLSKVGHVINFYSRNQLGDSSC
jgi:hypothetical protein